MHPLVAAAVRDWIAEALRDPLLLGGDPSSPSYYHYYDDADDGSNNNSHFDDSSAASDADPDSPFRVMPLLGSQLLGAGGGGGTVLDPNTTAIRGCTWCCKFANLQVEFGPGHLVNGTTTALALLLVAELLFLLVWVARALASALDASALNLRDRRAPVVHKGVYFPLVQFSALLFAAEAIVLFLPPGGFTTALTNLLLSVQCGVGDNFLLVFACMGNQGSRKNNKKKKKTRRGGGDADDDYDDDDDDDDDDGSAGVNSGSALLSAAGDDITGLALIGPTAASHYDRAFSRKSVVAAGMVCFAVLMAYMTYLQTTSARFVECSWCSLYLPTPGIFWFYTPFICIYVLWILLAVLEHKGLLPNWWWTYLRPRISILPWAIYMLFIYGGGNVGLGFVIFPPHRDIGYCLMALFVLFYTLGYAPVLYFVLRRDTAMLWAEHQAQASGTDATTALLAAYGDNGDVLDDLVGDSAVNRIKSSELALSSKIGVGGCAEVYRARWQGVDVAAKMLFAFSRKQERDALRDFVKECVLMAGLRHPNVLQLLGVVLDGDTRQPAMVFPFMAGGNLFDKLHPKLPPIPGKAEDDADADADAVLGGLGSGSGLVEQDSEPVLPLEWKRSMARQVACGMAFLHSQDVIHRDLKPQNLLLSASQREVLISDFGLSRIVTDHQTMTALGTAQWAAPEVLARERYSRAADVYSFGVVVWELVTEHVPFLGMSPVRVVGAVTYENARPGKAPRGSPELEPWGDLVEASWSEDPERRPTFARIMDVIDSDAFAGGAAFDDATTATTTSSSSSSRD